MSHFVIQHISTVWTKKSRGGHAAGRRNAVPTACTLPTEVFDSPFSLHNAIFPEHSDFRQEDEFKLFSEIQHLENSILKFFTFDDTIKVRFYRDGYNAATPSPLPYVDLFSLRESEWGSFIYNGRYADINTGNWWYEKNVYNIAIIKHANERLFLTSKPNYKHSELAKLL